MKRALDRTTVALLLAFLAGCASTTPPATTPAASPPAAPVAAAPTATPARHADDVAWVLGSAEYRAACWQAFALARRRVEELASGRPPGTWAVALDVDETVLSNVEHEVELESLGKDFDDATWERWVARRSATPLAGAVPFLERVHELGGRIALVTNRDESMRADTDANLRRQGVPFDLLLLRPDGGPSAKAPRWEAVQRGTAEPGVPPLEIVLWVGDNIRDFPGLDQSLRDAPPERLAAFGDRFVLVPNPLYGSWKPAQPAAAPAPAAAPSPPPPSTDVPVYVEGVAALLMKSLPAQLLVVVRGNLPDACTRLGTPSASRDGRTFHVGLPASREPGKVCTQALVPFSVEVHPDIVGLAGGTYTVEAGGKTTSFTLERDN
jgi:5'-nucleotidase (lipoprotein e(P4) family)